MKRPLGVALLGVVVLLVGLFLIAVSVFALFVTIAHISGRLPPEWEFSGIVQTQDVFWITAQLALGIAALVSGVGLLLLRAWAWLLALALLGCELVIQLSNYFRGRPGYWAMLLTALLVIYLHQRPIREAFHLAAPQPSLSAGLVIESADDDDLADTLAPGNGQR
jgi:hypothetical protein